MSALKKILCILTVDIVVSLICDYSRVNEAVLSIIVHCSDSLVHRCVLLL